MRKITGRKGYTIPAVMILMLLLFAFGIGILMFASYNYNNAFKRQEKMQTYFYAKNILDECEAVIMDGKLNTVLTSTVEDVNRQLSGTSNENLYGREYKVQMVLPETDLLVNSFNGDNVGLKMLVTYKPNAKTGRLPEQSSDYISIGDWMEIEFQIGMTANNRKQSMEYRIVSTFYCSNDSNKNPDGTLKDIADREVGTNMKWQPFQYSGQLN